MVFPFWADMYAGEKNRKAARVVRGLKRTFRPLLLEGALVEILGVYTSTLPDVEVSLSFAKRRDARLIAKKENRFRIEVLTPKDFFFLLELLLHETGHILQELGKGLTRPALTSSHPPCYHEAMELEASAWCYTVLYLAFPEEFEKKARQQQIARPFTPFLPPLDYSFGGVMVLNRKNRGTVRTRGLFSNKKGVRP